MDKFNETILEAKKDFFVNSVCEASKRLGVNPPRVKFWNCPEFTNSTIAHCHTDSFTICISESTLSDLDNSEISETANHEVTHLLHKDHGAHFHDTHEFLNIYSFKPRSGIVQVSEKELSESIQNKSSYSPNKRKCGYIQSSQHVSNTITQCIFCRRFFCKNHIRARPILSHLEISKIPYSFEKEVKNTEAHPCPDYTLFFLNKIKKIREDENEKINKISRKSKTFVIVDQKPKPRGPIFNSKAKITHLKKPSPLKKKKTLWDRIKDFAKE